MTSTNRALNRLLVIVVGLVLIAAGVALGAGSLLPDVQSTVSGAASDAKQPVEDALSGGQPWILWVVALVALVLIVVLAWFALRQGPGRTGTLVRLEGGRDASTPTGGSVVIDAKVAEQLLGDALRDDSAMSPSTSPRSRWRTPPRCASPRSPAAASRPSRSAARSTRP